MEHFCFFLCNKSHTFYISKIERKQHNVGNYQSRNMFFEIILYNILFNEMSSGESLSPIINCFFIIFLLPLNYFRLIYIS